VTMKKTILVAATCVRLLAGPSPARALPTGDPGDRPVNRCVDETRGSLGASPASIPLGGSTTLRWSVSIPSNCTNVRVYFGSQIVNPSGSQVVAPLANSLFRLRIRYIGYGEKEIASAPVAVILPPRVEITGNHQVPTFVQAVGTPGTTVVVANHVQLDLSGRQYINVATGVILRGGRGGLQAGPRLFTTTRPPVLLYVGPGASGVRITGVRIEGPDLGSDERHGNRGIHVNSAADVQIDNNELLGFSLAAIQVWDTEGTMASPDPAARFLPTHTVRIHDNYIHHNQAVGGDGYGVTSGYGAHPLISRNVFDWNRHAIEGDGKEGTGYTAYENLVLEHGGLHRWIPFPGFWVHTHQFDMHGLNDCGVWDIFSDSLANCGPAGHTMLIRRNTFFYSEDNAIKLRGTPAVGMFVGDNIFANHLTFGSAVAQNESGLVREPGNVLGYNGSLQLGTCDFDGDGLDDWFMATGATWWFSSGRTRPWTYLNTSTIKLSEMTLGHFDGDRRCDVSAAGRIFPGGRAAPDHVLPGVGTVGAARAL
jgi:hypothetical protein